NRIQLRKRWHLAELGTDRWCHMSATARVLRDLDVLTNGITGEKAIRVVGQRRKWSQARVRPAVDFGRGAECSALRASINRRRFEDVISPGRRARRLYRRGLPRG